VDFAGLGDGEQQQVELFSPFNVPIKSISYRENRSNLQEVDRPLPLRSL
jgi:hypothetical protein